MTTLAPTLSARYLPGLSARLRDILLIILGTLLVALLAQIEIPLPFTPVPITGQTFGVLLIGAGLGSLRGAASLSLYLVAGVIGFPFFAGGASGVEILSGATAGYLVGFIAAAFVIGRLAERGLDRSMGTSLLPFVVGTIIIYLFGAAWLAVLMNSLSKAVALGVIPFLVGDAIKLVLASLALPAAWKLAGTDRRR